MNATELINYKRDIFIQESIQEGFSEKQANKFFDITCNYIERLKKVRLSDSLTNEVIDELISLSEKWKTEETYYIASKYSHVKKWILEVILEDKTYWYAKLHLVQYYYRKNRMNPFDLKDKIITKSELEELILKEEPKPNYRVKDDIQINEIHQLLNEKAISCDSLQFINGIEAANLNIWKIKKQNVVQDLTYRLKNVMGDDWYTDTCKNMKWKKVIVSGHKSKLEGNPTTKKLDHILPRPKKE